jgi:hypothetical protein
LQAWNGKARPLLGMPANVDHDELDALGKRHIHDEP